MEENISKEKYIDALKALIIADSLGTIGLEVFREIYGCGANGRVGGI